MNKDFSKREIDKRTVILWGLALVLIVQGCLTLSLVFQVKKMEEEMEIKEELGAEVWQSVSEEVDNEK